MGQIQAISNQVKRSSNGSVFFISDFAANGNDKYISRVLSQDCVANGVLMKIANGIYYKPEVTQFGVLKPSVDQIAHAIAKRDGVKILPTGETALYLLGFSTQIPMRHVYLTSGSVRTIKLGGQTLTFQWRTPKTFAYRGTLTPMLVQALRAIGQSNIGDSERNRTKEILRTIIRQEEWDGNINLPPLWIKRLFVELKNEIDNE